MSKKGPIILVDDDLDECKLIQEVLEKTGIPNKLVCYTSGLEALGYLETTTEQPFLIIADINMPVMGGLELRQKISEHAELTSKAIPFIFLTTSATPSAVKEAYRLSVQGFFEKQNTIDEISSLLKLIYEYWSRCHHPNN